MANPPQPLPGGGQPQNTTLDGSGNGVAQIGPQLPRQHWQIAQVSVKCSSNVKEAICSIYVGSNLSSATFMGSTFTGSTGDNIPLGGFDIQPGQFVFAQWSGGDVGATATVVVFGTYTTGAPQSFLGSVGAFLNRLIPFFRAGNTTIINKSGLFVYNGVPATGNLVLAIAPVAGTDPFGNPYRSVFNIFGSGGASIQGGASGGVPFLTFWTGNANEALPAQIKAGYAGGVLQNIFASATDNTSADAVFVNVQATPTGTPNRAKGLLAYVKAAGGFINLFSWGGDGVFRATLQGMVGTVDLSQTDTTQRSATTVALTALSPSYSWPANDVAVQTIFHLRIVLHATGGGNAGSMAISFYGVNVFSENFTAGQLVAGHAFTFIYDVDIAITAIGAAGNANVGGFRSVIDNTAGSSVATGTIEDLGNVINTTVAGALVFNWQWAAVTGGPTITGDFSRIKRIGA